MAKIRIMLADDHTLFRQGIRTLISAEADMEVVAEASNGGDAVEKAAEVRPDVVLMDIRMPIMDGLATTRQIREFDPFARVVVVTDYDDDDLRAAAFEAGACGYALKQQLSDLPRILCSLMGTS